MLFPTMSLRHMRYQTLWLLLLLNVIGCGFESQMQPIASPLDSLASSAPAAIVLPTAADAQPDYAPTTPLPATGKVTIRADIRSLELDRLIAECPADSGPYAFAESTHYQVQICSAEYDPWQPKYYISQSKTDSSRLEITSTDPDEARQLMFRNAGYSYIIYRDSARPELTNAYLEIYSPDGNQSAEALLYLYEMEPPR